MNFQIQPRDDYREFLLSFLLFIGKIPREQVKFYKPGSISCAHWMAKTIYCRIFFLFRDLFHLTASEINEIRETGVFELKKISNHLWY